MHSTRLATPALIFCLASLCYADLTGTQVTGSAVLPPSTVNQFDPAQLPAPSYCGNTGSTTVTIVNSSSVPYTFCALFSPAGGSGGPPANAIVAQFTGSVLTIQVSLGTQPAWTPFQMTFTDSAFAGLEFLEYTDDFLCAPDRTCLSASLSGNTITVTGGAPPSGGVYNAAFTLTAPGPSFSVIAPPEDSVVFRSPTVYWNPAPGAPFYIVWLAGAPNETTYNSWQIPPNITSHTAPVVVQKDAGGGIAYVWEQVNGNWTEADSVFSYAGTNLLGNSAANPGFLGSVGWDDFLYPLNGTTNVDPFKAFIWTGGGNTDGSNLIVGTSPGASDVFNSGTIQDTQTIPPARSGGTLQVPGLQPNTTYYARLTGPPGFNTPRDVSFTTGVGRAHLISPADEAQQVDTTNPVSFTINSVVGAQDYVLWLGSTVGGNDVAQGWPGLVTSTTITLYPNHIYYARLWTLEATGQWVYVDSRFSTFNTDVAFVSFPANGDLHGMYDVQPSQPLTPAGPTLIGWKAIPDAVQYSLWVGTSPGASDVGQTNQVTVTGNVATAKFVFLENKTYYLTLFTNKGPNWYNTQSVFSTYPQNPDSQYGDYPY